MEQEAVAGKKTPRPGEVHFTAIFWTVGLVLGLLFCVFIPYGAGFDESHHAVRTFGVSGFDLVPNSKGKAEVVFGELVSLSYQRRYYQEPAWDTFSKRIFTLKGDPGELTPVRTWSIYFPVIYFPPAFVAGLAWRVFSLPIIPTIILMRVAGLLVYLTGSYLALRWAPAGKWLFLVLCLSPTALFQAATLNADGFSNLASFLFLALLLNILVEESTTVPGWKIWALMAATLLVGMAKPGLAVMLLLLVLLPFGRFPSRRMKGGLVAAAVLALLIQLGWLVFSIQYSHFAEGRTYGLESQFLKMTADPGGVLLLFLEWLWLGMKGFTLSWVASYGYWVGKVPGIIYILYPLALVMALLSERKALELSRKQRIAFLVTFVLGVLVLAGLAFYAMYPPDMTNPDRQGRYLTAVAPLFFLALLGLLKFPRLGAKQSHRIATSLLLTALVFFSIGLYATYYTYCGSSYYTFKPCVQPLYKNMDEETSLTLLLRHDIPVRQEFQSVCGSVSKVDVFVSEVIPGQSGSLLIELLGESGVSYASATVPLSSITPMAYLHLTISPEVEQVGDRYGIALFASGMDPSASISIARTEYDVFKLGDLYYANQPYPTNLIFRYTCRNPWQDLLTLK